MKDTLPKDIALLLQQDPCSPWSESDVRVLLDAIAPLITPQTQQGVGEWGAYKALCEAGAGGVWLFCSQGAAYHINGDNAGSGYGQLFFSAVGSLWCLDGQTPIAMSADEAHAFMKTQTLRDAGDRAVVGWQSLSYEEAVAMMPPLRADMTRVLDETIPRIHANQLQRSTIATSARHGLRRV